jgi:hypothetical protein
MADSTLIPPVGSSKPVPKSQLERTKKDRSKRQPQRPVPKKPKRDDDRPSIDEYA